MEMLEHSYGVNVKSLLNHLLRLQFVLEMSKSYFPDTMVCLFVSFVGVIIMLTEIWGCVH